MFNRVDKVKLVTLDDIIEHASLTDETLCYVSENLDMMLMISKQYGAVLYDKDLKIVNIYTSNLERSIADDMLDFFKYDADDTIWQCIGIDAVDYRVL